MKHYGHLGAETSVDERPGENQYETRIFTHGNDEPAALVRVPVHMINFTPGKATVERLRPDDLQDVPDGELLKIAEIEMNSLPGLLKYVELPGTPAQP